MRQAPSRMVAVPPLSTPLALGVRCTPYRPDRRDRTTSHGRRRVRERIESVPEEEFAARCASNHPHAGKTLRQLLDVNLAHVREHGARMLAFVREHLG